MIDFKEFSKYVEEHIKDFLPEEFQNGSIESVQKQCVNGGIREGITIRNEFGKPTPCLYMEQPFEEYKAGTSPDLLCQRLAVAFEEAYRAPMEFDIKEIMDFDKVKDKIELRLINTKQNSQMIYSRPHTYVSDLTAVYHINLGDNGDGKASIAIDNEFLKAWGVTTADIHAAAMENCVAKENYSLSNIESMLFSLESENLLDGNEHTVSSPMLVLTNQSRIHGANVLANPDVLSRVVDVVKDDIYILPSSLHEVLIVPKTVARDMGMDPKALGEMVREVNATQVEKDERLSDHIYEFNRDDKELKIVKDSREKSKDMER